MRTVDLGGVDATVAKYQGLIISPHVELFCFNLRGKHLHGSCAVCVV